MSCKSIVYFIIIGLIVPGAAGRMPTQGLVITIDMMNYAALERAEAVEAGMNGDIAEACIRIDTANALDPYDLETGMIIRLLHDLDAGMLSRPEASQIFREIWQIYTGMKGKWRQPMQTLPPVLQNPVAAAVRGRISDLAGDREQARSCYALAAVCDPAVPVTYLWRAGLFRRDGDRQRAVDDLEQCLQLAPRSYQACFELGGILLEMKAYHQAVVYFERALAVNPGYACLLQPNLDLCAAYNGRGCLALQSGDIAGALNDFNRAIELNPRFGEFYLNRGIAWRRAGELQAALKDFDRAVVIDGRYTDAYLNRGLLFRDLRYYSQALRDFERVLGFDKTHIAARYQIGSILLQQQEYAAAISVFDTLLVYHPEHYRAVYAKALALDELRHYRQAAEAYELFFQMAPDTLYDHKIKAWERSRLIRKVLHGKYGVH